MCFLCWHSTFALEKDNLLQEFFARVNAMEEDLAFPKEEHARQIHSSLHSTRQRSHHWVENQCLHRQCLFCVSCEHQAIKTLLFTATYFYKIEICAIKSPFFLCQHKWKCLPSYFPYTMRLCLPSLTLISQNECSSSFCTYHWQHIPCLEQAT